MTRRFVLALALVFISAVAEAQEVALRFVVVPQVTVQGPMGAFLASKYINSVDLPGVFSSAITYGREDMRLVGAWLTNAQVTTISSNLDATFIPANLNSQVSAAALATIQTKLEGWKIPSDGLTTASTWRQVVGRVVRTAILAQRFDGLFRKSWFDASVTLDTRVNQLSQTLRNNLQAAAQDLGLDTSFITGTMLMREVLVTWGNALPPISVEGEQF